MPELLASIVIPTRNRATDLRRCLDLLLPQIPEDGSMEIVVGDDSDGDETADLLKHEFPAAVRQPGPRIGPGANRNHAARVARGEWLIFLDDDCLPSPTLIAAYADAIRQGGPEPKFFLNGPILRTDAHKDSLLWEAPRNEKPDLFPPSCNFAMPRAIFLASGGFDERYRTSFEDMEFFARLNLQDITVHFLPEAAVDHPSRPLPSPAKLARRWEARVISSFDFGASVPQVIRHLPRHVLLVILSRFRGRSPSLENLRAAAVFGAEFACVLSQLPGWLSKYGPAPRSPFWTEQVRLGKAPPRFGL